ncbi:Imm26 family immunity protein [Rubritalea marina]|uniref:Imm26 family immunity protein n=1 Tax=Rubritalea marina TaxID=361055 RepID=UPI000370A625|nr:Imm26 family immunity protein [Rubritalea marina]
MAQRKNWDSGNIVEIALPSGGLTYAMVVDSPRVAFFDRKFDSRPAIREIADTSIAFQIWVMKYAIGKRHWSVIGATEVPPAVLSADRFFKQDSISGEFSIYEGAGHESPASYSDVVELECAAVWDPEHIESRLDDHYAGVENMWVRSLAPKKPTSRTSRG